jgi:hypothetical protein
MFTRRLDLYFLGLLALEVLFFFAWLRLAQQLIGGLPSGGLKPLVIGQLGLLSIGAGLLVSLLVETSQGALKEDDAAQLSHLKKLFQKTLWMMMLFFLSSLLVMVKLK